MNNNNSNNNNYYYFIIIIIIVIVIVVIINMVCKDVVTEPVFQDVEREQLTRGSYKAQDARLDIHARGFLGAPAISYFSCQGLSPECGP